MADKAYTIGHPGTYDPLLKQSEQGGPNLWKRGANDDGEGDDYAGGMVWRTAKEASEHVRGQWRAGPSQQAEVYELELPTGWDTDVAAERVAGECWHRLLNGARVLRKVTTLSPEDEATEELVRLGMEVTRNSLIFYTRMLQRQVARAGKTEQAERLQALLDRPWPKGRRRSALRNNKTGEE